MKVWRSVDRYTAHNVITEINEIGQYRQWCEDNELAWNIRKTTLYAMGWTGVRQFLQERGKRFTEVKANG